MTVLSILLLSTCAAVPPVPPATTVSPDSLLWNERAVEHLLNRAGLGASVEEIRRGMEMGAEAFVQELLDGRSGASFGARSIGSTMERRRLRDLPEEQRREEAQMIRRDDREQLNAFLLWWFDRLLTSSDVLEERMVLFWHGHFPSSQQDVQRSREMIGQNQLFRENALGSFRDLVHGIAKDPAMLEYLDNDSNRKGKPNENFARELLELFTLGEGNYTEDDIKEIARAFTGWTDREGQFFFAKRQHDDGEKRIFGRRGAFGGEEVIDMVLARGECTEYLAGELLRYFEGVEPSERRLKRYAKLLRKEDYELRPFLRTLFLDPDFYSEAVVGARVSSPVDFLVGVARRGHLDPPSRLVAAGAALLGERLCFPPSVEGWAPGTAWITTGTLLMRANLAGVLVGEVKLKDLLERGENDPSLEGFGGLAGRAFRRLEWQPRTSLSRAMRAAGHGADAEMAAALTDMLLAVEPSSAVRTSVESFLSEQRREAGIENGALLDRARIAEPCLRRTAHYILSLPEAQLH